MLFRLESLFVIFPLAALLLLTTSQFMVIRVRENSMNPVLRDGQWALVLRGVNRVRIGDIALFHSPEDGQLVVKRSILKGDENPRIKHGWLMTPWGDWFLTGKEWTRLTNSPKPPTDSFFMVGDNQFRSLDSRQYGYVDRDRMVGRVLIRRHRD